MVVLVIDENDELRLKIRNYIRRILQKPVKEVKTKRIAWELITKNFYKCIFLTLSDVSALRLLKNIKTHEKSLCHKSKVIIIAKKSSVAMAVRCMKMGAADYISETSSLSNIFKRLKEHNCFDC